MKRPRAIFAGLILLTFFAAASANVQFQSGQPSEYLVGGYRGGVLLLGLAVLLYFFPRVMRWPVGLLLILVALFQNRTSAAATIVCGLSFATGVWLFVARFSPKPKPPISSDT